MAGPRNAVFIGTILPRQETAGQGEIRDDADCICGAHRLEVDLVVGAVVQDLERLQRLIALQALSLLVLLSITSWSIPVESTSVTSKGQVTIPKRLRQKLGLRQGSKVAFVLVGDRVEMRVVSTLTAATATTSGFGLLTSKRKPVPAEFDVASLLSRRRATRST